MYLDAAVMDTEEALRTLKLLGTKAGQFDTHMHVKGQKQGEIKGESLRPHGDGKPYHAVLGYYLAAGTPVDSASGLALGRRRYSALRVVRSSDSSSASLMSAFAQNESLDVELNNYRAGGDDAKDALPMFKITLENARVKTFTLMFGGALPNTGAVEIIEIAFRNIEIEAAPQTATGQRDGVKTFSDIWSEQT